MSHIEHGSSNITVGQRVTQAHRVIWRSHPSPGSTGAVWEPRNWEIGTNRADLSLQQAQGRDFGRRLSFPEQLKNRRLFSPEIFGAGFIALPEAGEQAAHLLSANLFRQHEVVNTPRRARRCAPGAPARSVRKNKMPWREGAGQSRSRPSIYLVDNKYGGKNWA